jgi:hypothetical protein
MPSGRVRRKYACFRGATWSVASVRCEYSFVPRKADGGQIRVDGQLQKGYILQKRLEKVEAVEERVLLDEKKSLEASMQRCRESTHESATSSKITVEPNFINKNGRGTLLFLARRILKLQN